MFLQVKEEKRDSFPTISSRMLEFLDNFDNRFSIFIARDVLGSELNIQENNDSAKLANLGCGQ